MMQSYPKTITLTYTDGPRSIQFRAGEIIYWVDGIEKHFKSILVAVVYVKILVKELTTVAAILSL